MTNNECPALQNYVDIVISKLSDPKNYFINVSAGHMVDTINAILFYEKSHKFIF
jgi:hypothetical protein